ncbi:hypothetical protein BDV09DRAFT_193452 [Aspergillus tetrazonus]
MAAIAQARDSQLVRLLVENGASLTSKNDRGETAEDLARQSTNPNFTQALDGLNYFPQYKDIIRDSYKDVVAYSSPSQQPGYSTKQDIENPKTEDDWKQVLLNFAGDMGLEDFYPTNSPTIAAVAKNAVAAQNDPLSILSMPAELKTLSKLAFYQPIFYCDDSCSMNTTDNQQNEDRWSILKTLVAGLAEVITKFKNRKPAHLRFINNPEKGGDDIEYDKLADHRISQKEEELSLVNDQPLLEPLFIMTITDGVPGGGTETMDTFRNVVEECATWVVDHKSGYDKKVVKHSLNQIGPDVKAKAFLQGFIDNRVDPEILYIAAERLDSEFQQYRDNKEERLRWLYRRYAGLLGSNHTHRFSQPSRHIPPRSDPRQPEVKGYNDF